MSNEMTATDAWLPMPGSMAEAVRMAEFLCKGSLVPKAFREQPANLLIAADFSRHLGLPLLSGLRAIYVVSGKASLTSEGMLAVCSARDDFEDIIETWNSANQVATCTIKRVGRTPVMRSFSMQDADNAGVLSSDGNAAMYRKWPQRMLLMRARAFALRDAFADALAGLGACAEEIANVPDVTDDTVWDAENGQIRPAASVTHAPRPAAASDGQDAPQRPRRSRTPTGRPRGRPRKQPVVIEAATPELASEPTTPDWAERLAGAPTLEQLVVVGREVADAVSEGPELARLRRLYAERQQQLVPAMPGAGANGGDASGIEAMRRRQAERGQP